MPRLTDLAVRSLQPDPLKIVRKWDGDGLHIECRPNGSKYWIFKYSVAGRRRRMSLGVYPKVSLKEARDRHADGRRLLRDGIDPQVERVRLKRAKVLSLGTTVQSVADEWFADQAPKWTPAYAGDVQAAFRRHIYPRLGKRPIAEVTSAELFAVLRGVHANGRLELVRRLRQKCEAVWNRAIVSGRATVNIAAPIKGEFPAPEIIGFPMVPEAVLPALLVDLRTYGNPWIEAAVLLQLLTASRPVEAREARWDEFDEDAGIWTVPGDRMKAGEPHVVPLSRQVVQVLDYLRPLSGHAPVLFPSRSAWSEPMSENTIGACLRRLKYTPGISLHGMRKTFSTAANSVIGHHRDVIEACLSHTETNKVRAVYNLAAYTAERRALLQWWADRVERLCNDYTSPRGLAPIFPPT